MSTIKVDTIATRSGSGSVTVSNNIALATEGQIDINSTNLLVRSTGNKSGLRFDTNSLTPFKNGSQTDNAVDLGFANARFKDLYLSGGLYVGGTGAANTLDDYEEGTHQTAISMGTSGTVTLNGSFDRFSYTKVGRLVTITGNPRISSVSSPVGSMSLTLPFAAANGQTDECRSGGFIKYYDNSGGSGSYIKIMGCNVNENTSALSLNNTHTHGQNVTPGASDEIYLSFSYIAAT